MNDLLRLFEIAELTILLIYDHKVRRLPNIQLLILLCIVMLQIWFSEINIQYQFEALLMLFLFFVFYIGAIGAGDSKLMMVMSLLYSPYQNILVVSICLLIGVGIGMIYRTRNRNPFSISSIICVRTQFPFMYACYPVYILYLFVR
jgi:Flp pilus assembly protein protease CpaA